MIDMKMADMNSVAPIEFVDNDNGVSKGQLNEEIEII